MKYERFYYNSYDKRTFSGVYSNFYNFIADEYEHGLIFTLLFGILQ